MINDNKLNRYCNKYCVISIDLKICLMARGRWQIKTIPSPQFDNCKKCALIERVVGGNFAPYISFERDNNIELLSNQTENGTTKYSRWQLLKFVHLGLEKRDSWAIYCAMLYHGFVDIRLLFKTIWGVHSDTPTFSRCIGRVKETTRTNNKYQRAGMVKK